MGVTLRFGLALIGRELEPRPGGCAWVEDGIITSITGSSSCPREYLGGDDYLLLPQPGLAHVHSADHAFPEYGVSARLQELVAPPSGEKHRRLSQLNRRVLVQATREYYTLAERLGVGILGDFRELGGLGCTTAREASEGLPLDVAILGRPGPGWPEGCEGLGLSSPLDYPESEARRLAANFRPSAAHVAETPEMRLRGDFEVALRAGFNFIVHGTFLSPEDLKLLAESGMGLVLCVRSNMWHSLGLPPVRDALEMESLRVALGTDNASWAPPDPWGEALLALHVARLQGLRGDRAAWRVLEALFVAPYELLGRPARLVAEGLRAHVLLVKPVDASIWRAESVYSWIAKRVGTGFVGYRIDGDRVKSVGAMPSPSRGL